ncbi:MAG: hypothetical protein H0V84_07425 [Actinobacteria bacterium]|nr:hypothetical protein [Actinomycetota bacterium]
MPSRKQRRRRAKDRRHEYEYVLVDSEGHEVEGAEEEEPRPDRRARTDARAERPRGGSARPAQAGRGGRKVEPASWRRVARRSLIFAPLMFITVVLLNRKQTTGAHLVTTAFLLTFFVPFQYVMDTIVYRSYLRRTGQGASGKGESKPAKRR